MNTTDLYTILSKGSSSSVARKRTEFEFTLPDGSIGRTNNKSDLFTDGITGLTYSRNYTSPSQIYHKGKIVDAVLKSGFKSIKVSKFLAIHTTDNTVYFKEHSGAGFNGPKKFAKPNGEALGIEIEVAFKGDRPLNHIERKLAFSQWIGENYPDWITERDGSLEDWCHNNSPEFQNATLELVSPPLPPKELIEALSVILPKMEEFGAFIPSDWFGIHITTNIYGRHIKKSAARFINAVHGLPRFWKSVSRRALSDALKKYAAIHKYNCADEELIRQCNSDHYRAVFARNLIGNAVELRIFKSSVSLNTVLAIVELTTTLSRYSLSTATDWLRYISESSSNRLIEYLDFCGVRSMLFLDNERDELLS